MDPALLSLEKYDAALTQLEKFLTTVSRTGNLCPDAKTERQLCRAFERAAIRLAQTTPSTIAGAVGMIERFNRDFEAGIIGANPLPAVIKGLNQMAA